MSRHHISWLYPIAGFSLYILLFLSFSRIGLSIWQAERIEAVDGFQFIFFQGLRFDIILIAQFLIIPIILLPLLCLCEMSARISLTLLKIYLVLVSGFIVFLEFVTPNFILQYDFRPNILFVEYLLYPKEVMSMLMKAVPLQLTACVGLTIIFMLLIFNLLSLLNRRVVTSVGWSAPIVSILGFLICVLLARSTLGHRPVNPSVAAFSPDPLMNSLSLSSAYSVIYAMYEKQQYIKSGVKAYGKMTEEDMYSLIYQGSGKTPSDFTDNDIPTLHFQKLHSGSSQERKNIVILLEESLGADFVGALTGANLTPNIDQLSKEGMWFEQLYATGTRSVRGIEAVVTGFLPTQAESTVKLPGSQHNFFTIARLLKQKNYSTSFIYGGEAHFDNMKGFFSNNGFDTVIEEKDYINPVFSGSWGVSDEDLFFKAHETFNKLAHKKEYFFSLVFTSTNHSPFEFPDNRITLAEYPKNTVANAVKYADHALGEFISRARKSEYWNNTIFLIIADHSDRVYGSELVPISKFRIPALILGKDIEAKKVTRIASQIDMLPTLLSLAGVEASHPGIGLDLTHPEVHNLPGRAIMQFGKTHAYMEEDRVVIQQVDKLPLQFNYVDNKLILGVLDRELKNRALASSLWPMVTYKNKTYRLPKNNVNEKELFGLSQ